MTLADHVYEDLASRIECKEALPCKLTFSALAKHYKVSLTPVRTAVTRLVNEGYLKTLDNGRLQVGDSPPAAKRRPKLSVPLELPHGRLEADRVDDGELTSRLTEVVVRMRRPGDALAPGRHGTHRLKERFRQAGIPPWERSTYPVIVVDDEVALIPGIGVAARYAAHGAGWRVRWQPRHRP